MSEAVETLLTRVEFKEGNSKKSYLVEHETALAVETLLAKLNEERGHVLATELFPELGDPNRTPGIALKGIRLRQMLTQKQMAEKIGVTQGDLSKMESGERPIGRKLAMRIGEAFGIEYTRFL